ncbi:MAG: TSUP family transporter [Alphaproteobacteria bacterium]|nr:TSUP family transporter [Alphaproteobacteria bacterium]
MATTLAHPGLWLTPTTEQYGLLVVSMLGAGLFAGFVAGMFGIGGGFVVVPALAAVLTLLGQGSTQSNIMHVAIGTSLATILFTSLRSVQAHAKRGAVDWKILKGWLPSVIAGVIVGVILTSMMDGRALKVVFGVGVLLMGLHFLFPVLAKKTSTEEKMPTGPIRAALGSSLGAFCSLLGIGGGTPAVLIMTMNGVSIHRAIATAAGFGTLIAIPGAIGNVLIGLNTPNLPLGSLGYVNLIALAAIVAMSFFTAPLGVAAAHSLDPVKLKRVFGVYLVITAGFMLKGLIPFGLLFGHHA